MFPAGFTSFRILRDGSPQLSFRETTAPVAFTLEFGEEDFHSGVLNVNFTGVKVIFDCLGAIQFRINVLYATSTNFFATKHMDVEYSNSVLPSQLNYPSFISGFIVGAIFANYLLCMRQWQARVVVVDLPTSAGPSSFPSELQIPDLARLSTG
jgi:hypothetical protein